MGKNYGRVAPRISVVTITTRPGMFRLGKETLQMQTLQDFEWIVIDGLYHRRKDQVADFMRDWENFEHVPDPPKVRKYNLAAADNTGIKSATGELIVWLQDFILIPQDGLEKFWNLYQNHKRAIFSGVDGRFEIQSNDIDPTDLIDVLKGGGWSHGRTDYVNRRAFGKTKPYRTYDPFEFELNYAAFPRSLAEEMGGFNEEFDDGFGFDNTEFAFRALQLGAELWIDPTNYADAINHWVIFGERLSDPYVPDRGQSEIMNDYRFLDYQRSVKAGVAPIIMPYV